MTTSNNKDDGLPVVELDMTQAQASRLRWSAFTLGGLSIVASILTAAAWLPVVGMQIAGTVAAVCTGLSWYIARRAPSSATRRVVSNAEDRD